MTITHKQIASVALAAILLGTFTISLPAFAFHSPQHYTLFGDAAYVSPGNASARAVHIESDAIGGGFGGVNFPAESGITFADLTTLSTDYKIESDDACLGGSPRFQIEVQTPSNGVQNIFAYFGPDSGGAPCVIDAWANTGDFLEVGRKLDTSQLGGTFYDTYANALANYGSYPVVSIQVVGDASWAFADSEQAFNVDNTLINSTLFTYEVPTATTKDECKNGGWKNLTDTEGNTFKNQGDCVSFVATNGQNEGSGN